MQVLTSDTAITKTINVGTIGKASTVKLYGCTFSDLTTTKAITGAVALDIVIPAPTSVSDSTLADVYVDGTRVESFQVVTSGIRQFDPRYLVRPFMKEDADLAYGPVLASAADPMVFIDLSTLPKLTAMPAKCNFIYYDYVTDTMYYFGAISALNDITAATQVWTESFASDPVVDYISVGAASGAIVGYHFIFTASGKVIELFAPNTANFKLTRTLPHKIKSATVTYVSSTATSTYLASTGLIVLDDKGNLYKYKLRDLTLIGSVLNTNLLRLVGSTASNAGPNSVYALSSEPRKNMYYVDSTTTAPPKVTRHASSTDVQNDIPNIQFIDSFSIGGYGGNGGRWLAYNFNTNKLVYIDGFGNSVFSYDFTTDNNLSTLGGRLVYGYSQTASTDGVIRSLYQNLKYTSTKNYVGDKAWSFLSGDSNYSIGRIRKVAKSYLIDGSSYSLSDMPSNVKFNGKSLSFKLAGSTLTGFKIVLPPELAGTITVNGISSDLTVPSGEVQITFATAPTQTNYYLAIGHTLFNVSVDGMYSLTIGTAGKNSVVTLYGCTFSDDGTTTRNITGRTEISVIVPAPATAFESNIAEVYVDGKRVAYYTRQPYVDEVSLKQFNPAYFTRPYLNSDIDSTQGILKIIQSQTASGLPTFLRLDTLARRPVRPTQTKYCYYDYYTDKMYWFEVASPDQIGASSYVYVEDFSADPLAGYQQVAYVVGSDYYGDLLFTLLFHKSGKVRLQHPYDTQGFTYSFQLPHDIVAGCGYGLVFSASMSLDATANIIVSDSAGNTYRYNNLKTTPSLQSKVSGPKVVRFAAPRMYTSGTPKIYAISRDVRANTYSIDTALSNLSLERQPVNDVTKNMQSIDASNYFNALLSYDFSAGRLRVVKLDGTDVNATYAKNFARLSGTAGNLVDSLHPLIVSDAFMRSYDRNLPHVSTTLAYANPVTFLDANTDYNDTSLDSGTYNNKADGVVEAIVANAVGPTVVESILYDWSGTNTEGKKVKYIDIYNWDGTQYVLHATLNTSPVVLGIRTESLVLATPMLLHSSRKIKLAARSLWGGYGDLNYRWVTEISLMLRSA